MAKVSAKKATPVAKKVSTPRKPKATVVAIDKACEQALDKLKELNIDPQLQADIAWCLGSYRYDQNPIGLFQTGAKALEVLHAAKAKSARAVSAKIIADLKKALKQD
jgi:hypothetical protein